MVKIEHGIWNETHVSLSRAIPVALLTEFQVLSCVKVYYMVFQEDKNKANNRDPGT